jgi:hypothetical protein
MVWSWKRKNLLVSVVLFTHTNITIYRDPTGKLEQFLYILPSILERFYARVEKKTLYFGLGSSGICYTRMKSLAFFVFSTHEITN